MKRSQEECGITEGPSTKKSSYAQVLHEGQLYFSKPDTHDTSDQDVEELSLTELLAIIKPIRSLHLNFEIDIDWLISCYPSSSRGTPITLIVGSADAKSKQAEAKRYENVQVFGASLPYPFGTHHSKVSILESEERVHVIISTSNLIGSDWLKKTQMFYHASGKKLATREGYESCWFQKDLLEYLIKYNAPIGDFRNLLINCDLSHIEDRLVCSVPGYHKGAEMNKWGHLKLRNLLDDSTEDSNSPLMVAQCSSIGFLGKTPDAWLKGEMLKSLKGASEQPRMVLLYPTEEEVRCSTEGYDGGICLPYSSVTHAKQEWLREIMCKWRGDHGRERSMPHCKTYVKIAAGKVLWQVMTSANLSKSAWGELKTKGSQFFIRSYEVGVLIRDEKRIRLPYKYPVAKYQLQDEPWFADANHCTPDRFGDRWIVNSNL